MGRDKIPPFLLRIFLQKGNHLQEKTLTGILNGSKTRGTEDELQVYTWRDATLRELADLILDVVPETREFEKCLVLNFRLVYPGRRWGCAIPIFHRGFSGGLATWGRGEGAVGSCAVGSCNSQFLWILKRMNPVP